MATNAISTFCLYHIGLLFQYLTRLRFVGLNAKHKRRWGQGHLLSPFPLEKKIVKIHFSGKYTKFGHVLLFLICLHMFSCKNVLPPHLRVD